jgi:hypothetical protein
MTGEEVLEWMEHAAYTVSGWQADLLRRTDWSQASDTEIERQLWPEPSTPVLTRRVQRRRYSRAARKRHRRAI